MPFVRFTKAYGTYIVAVEVLLPVGYRIKSEYIRLLFSALLDSTTLDSASTSLPFVFPSFQAVEKWIALVRFRKAVNAHTTEVTRLQNLLNIAQGGEERSRLTSELEQVSNRFSLEDMEDAMHMEVRTYTYVQISSNASTCGDTLLQNAKFS